MNIGVKRDADPTFNRSLPNQRLLYLIKRVHQGGKIALDRATRAYGMSLSDFTMLSFLHRLEPCSAADLARAQRVTPQAATQQVAQLIAKGLVSRRESDANRRISLISMTAAGRDNFASVSAKAARIEDEMLGGLTSDEREFVLNFLARSATILERKERTEND